MIINGAKVVKNYYVVFRKVSTNVGQMAFVVENKEIAIQFCEDNPEFYWLSREQVVEGRE